MKNYSLYSHRKYIYIYIYICISSYHRIIMALHLPNIYAKFASSMRDRYDIHSVQRSCDKVFQWYSPSRWFPQGTILSTNKADLQDITEILFKVTLNTKKPNSFATPLKNHQVRFPDCNVKHSHFEMGFWNKARFEIIDDIKFIIVLLLLTLNLIVTSI